MNYFTWTLARRSAALLQSRLLYRAWQHLLIDHTQRLRRWHNHILLFFSLFFFFLFQNTLPCVSSYRQVKVREFRGFTPLQFPVTGPYVGVCGQFVSEARFGFGLAFIWCEAAESFYGFVVATSKLKIVSCAGGDMEWQVAGKTVIEIGLLPPASVCIVEISSSVLRWLWKIQLLTHVQLLNYLKGLC